MMFSRVFSFSVRMCLLASFWVVSSSAQAQTTNALIGRVTGSIAVPGQLDRYRFDLDTRSLFYLDSLVNAQNLAWSLAGPTGDVVSQRTFNSTDGISIGDPVLELPPGGYTLSVYGTADAVGDYSFVFSNLKSARLINVGADVSGKLDPSYSTELLQFIGNAGDQLQFKAVSGVKVDGNTRVRVLDKYGVYVYQSGFANGAPFTLPTTGNYTMLIEGYINTTGVGTYTFNLQFLGNTPPTPLTGIPVGFGTNISGTIANAGDSVDYLLSLTRTNLMVFDTLSDVNGLNLTLKGPQGVLADRRSVANLDADRATVTPYELPPANYQIKLQGQGANTGTAQFRLVDVGAATAISLNVTNTATNTPARTTQVYTFQVSAGDQLFFDSLSSAGFNNTPMWRLVGPAGNQIWNRGFSDVDTDRFDIPGRYYLFVEGGVYDTAASGSYSFVVRRVQDGSQALVLGTSVTGKNTPGQRQLYTFSVPKPTLVVMDSFTDETRVRWNLDGPAGNLVNRRSIGYSDSDRIANAAISLLAGDYTLTFDCDGDLELGYQFKLVDLSTAQPLSLNATVNGTLPLARSAAYYALNITQPTTVYFDAISTAGFVNGTFWRLIDPQGDDVFRQEFGNIARSTLSAPGVYTLVVEGRVNDVASNASFSFVARSVVDTISTLVPNQTYSGDLAVGQQAVFKFSVPQSSFWLFDSLTERSELRWTLSGPYGVVANRVSFAFSDGDRRGEPVLNLAPGDYQLTLALDNDLTGPYAFRLLALANAIPISVDTVVAGTNAPSRSATLYRFNASAGDSLFFDSISTSGFSAALQWLLFDPYGRQVFNSNVADVDTLKLGYTGSYTLAVQGNIYDTAASGQYSFRLRPVFNGVQALNVGSVATGSLQVGQSQRYSFTVPSSTLLLLDILTETDQASMLWEGPNGVVMNWRQLNFLDADRFNSIRSVTPGSYVITVDGKTDLAPSYSFQILDVASATPVALDTLVTGTATPGRSTLMYRFDANAGDIVLFAPETTTGFNSKPLTRIVNSFGDVIFTSNFTESSPLTLTTGGSYTVLIEGMIYDSATSGTFGFTLRSVNNASNALTLGSTVTGVLKAGQELSYPFTITTPKVVVLDSLSERSDISWTLVGPQGVLKTRRSLSFADGERDGGVAFYLREGEYKILIDGNGQAEGPFSFRCLDASTAAPLTLGTPTDGVLTPGKQTTLFRFNATAGDFYKFGKISQTGFLNSTPTWKLVNAYGQLQFSHGFADVPSFGPLSGGTHYLLIEGQVYETAPSAQVKFSVNLLSNTPPVSGSTPLVLGTTVDSTIASNGEVDTYSFNIPTATWLHFDSFINNSSFRFSLEGPNGLVVNNRGFADGELQIYAFPGQFKFSVFANSGTTGNYKFRLLDTGLAQAITIGQAVTNTVTPGNGAQAYSFTATPGQRVYLQWLGHSGYSRTPYIQLMDRYGSLPINTFATTGLDVMTLAGGRYVFLVEGLNEDTGATGTHQFKFHPVTDDTNSLTLGSVVSGGIASPGQADHYTFNLSSSTRILFDVLTNLSGVYWTLDGPSGRIVNGRGFNSGDWDGNVTAGSYELTVYADRNVVANYSFKVLDYSVHVTPIALDSIITSSNFPAQSYRLFSFNGVAGQRIYFDSFTRSGFNNAPAIGLFDKDWNLLFNTSFSGQGPLVLPSTGRYVFLLGGQIYDASVVPGLADFKFINVLDKTSPLVLGAATTGSIDQKSQQATYTFSLPSTTRLFIDLFNNPLSFSWRLDGPSGQVVSPRGFGNSDYQFLALPGDYRLTVTGDSETVGSFGFSVSDMNQGTPIAFNTPISSTNVPASSARLFKFDGVAGQRVFFNSISRQGFANSPFWQTYDPQGNLILNDNFSTEPSAQLLELTGTYYLAVEGQIYDVAPTGIASFQVVTPTNVSIPLVFGQTYTSSIAVPGQIHEYPFTLATPARVTFDSLVYRGEVSWAIDSDQGRVTSTDFTQDSQLLDLAPGNYRLTVFGANHQTPSYSFRMLNAASAKLITVGIPVSGTNNPANSTTLYRFTAQAGDRLFFDYLARASIAPIWRLVDPFGKKPFEIGFGSDAGVIVMPVSGTYVLMFVGQNYFTDVFSSHTFNIVPSPLGAPQNILQPQSAPDLKIQQITSTPSSGIQSGLALKVGWKTQNDGAVATVGSWYDRVTIRNTTSGQIIINSILPYDESTPGNGPILPGQSRTRELSVTLPEGPAGAGALEVTVTADGGNSVAEQNASNTGESNNSTLITLNSALPSYPDLQVARVTASPLPGWIGGTPVTFSWRVTNAGPRTATGAWNDLVVVRNVRTSTVLTNAVVPFDTSAPGNAPIAPNGVVDRQISVVIPSDANGLGLFEIAATANVNNGLFEYAPGFDASANNQRILQLGSAPELQVEGLQVQAPIQSGAQLSIQWTDKNLGNVPVTTFFRDSVTIRNVGSSEVIAVTSVDYNPAQPALGPIAVNTGKARQALIQLPDGPRGAGALDVIVTTDYQDFIPEYSGLTPADTNNTAVVRVNSVLLPYPDLIVRNVKITPASLQSSGDVTVEWEDANVGNAPVTSDYSDRITVNNVSKGTVLLDANVSVSLAQTGGPIPVGGSRAVKRVFRLPNGDPGVGNLQFTLTADQGNSIFEYTAAGNAEQNNTTSANASSTLAAYPDLRVARLSVTPAIIAAGSNIVIRWTDTNAGTAVISSPWFDRITVVNTNRGVVLLDNTDFYNTGLSGSLTNGTSVSREFAFRIPDGANGVGVLSVLVSADSNDSIFELLAGINAETNNSAQIYVSSGLTLYPDLRVTEIRGPATALPGSTVPVAWTVRNDGQAASAASFSDQIYISNDAAIGSDTFLANVNFAGTLAPGQSLVRTQLVTLPTTLAGSSFLVVETDAGNRVFEENEANNVTLGGTALQLPSALVLSPGVLRLSEAAGNSAFIATVTRNGGVSTPLTIAVSADLPNQLILPTSIDIPAGQSLASFPVGVVNDAIAVGDRVVNLVVSAPGFVPDTNVITIVEDETPAITLRLSASSVPENAAPATVTGTVTRNARLNQAVTVQLTGDRVTSLSVPQTVVIPANQTSVSFNLITLNDSVVEGDRRVNIQASAPGFATATISIQVIEDDVVALSLIASDASVREGAVNPATTLKVRRTPVASNAQRVALDLVSGQLIQVPSEATIPAGQAEVIVPVNVGNNNQVTGPLPATIRATALNVEGRPINGAVALTSIVVQDDDGPTLAVQLEGSVIAEAGSTLGTVSRNTSSELPLLVNLALTPAGQATAPPTVLIPAGQSSAAFTIAGVVDHVSDGIQTVTLTATAANFNPGVAKLGVSDIDVPDLIVTEIQAPTNAVTDSFQNLTWTVSNQGLTATTGSWVDYVYFATDAQGGSAVLIGALTNTDVIAVGDSYSRSVSLLLPSDPGNYWIKVVTDATGALLEAQENNNSLVSSLPIVVQPSYRATVSTDIEKALAGTPIPLKGRTYFTADNTSAPNRNATVRLNVGDIRRVIQVRSDASGNFSTTFYPLPGEAGVYKVGADHPRVSKDPVQDQFTLIGMRSFPDRVQVSLSTNSPSTGTLDIRNLSPEPLTGITVTPRGVPNGVDLQVSLETDLAGGARGTLAYTVTTTLSTRVRGTLILGLTSAEGATLDIPVDFSLIPPTSQLVARPSFLEQGMLRGSQSLVSFVVVNQGGAPSGNLSVVLPNEPWLSLVSTSTIPSLAPGETNVVTLALTPAADLPLTRYDGNLAINGASAGVSIPFHFRAVSDARGDLIVTVTDANTYYAAGAPKVAGATVYLRDPISGEKVSEGTTAADGTFRFVNIREGTYELNGFAPKHSSARGGVTIKPGTTIEQELFIVRQTVTYEWKVEPTLVEDRYKVTLQPLFETEVPHPELVIENPRVVPLVIAGKTSQFEINYYNPGLIALRNIKIQVPQDPKYEITPLIDEIPELPAHGRLSVPVTIKLRAGLGLNAPGGCEDCVVHIPIDTSGFFKCGSNWQTVTRKVEVEPLCIEDTGCTFNNPDDILRADFATAASAAFNAQFDCLAGKMNECQKARVRGYLKHGDFGYLTGPFGDGISDFCACAPKPQIPGLLDFAKEYMTSLGFDFSGGNVSSVPASFFVPTVPAPCNSPVPPAAPALADTVPSTGKPVCAKVRIEVSQDITLTRNAFRGTLVVENGGGSTITGIQVTLDFKDGTNGSAGDKFLISGPVLTGVAAVDGTGSLATGLTLTANYIFLPTLEAAPRAPAVYRIGGTLRYIEDGTEVVLPLATEPITVLPEPRLELEYFQQRDVYADDPFTTEVEPSEPFALGLRVKNTGAGQAINFKISSGQPKIIENEKGLLIDFKLLGMRIGDQPFVANLNAMLGDIPAGSSRVVVWDMISSLQGKFIDYRASFEHFDVLGVKAPSLIEKVTLRELIHAVRADRAGDDHITDFLVNDIPDPDNFPDTLYLSEGPTVPVAPAISPLVDHVADQDNLVVQLQANVTEGWNYLKMPNPGADFRLLKVVRSDGKVLILKENAWVTDRTFPSSKAGAVHEQLFHLLDFGGSGKYTLFYGLPIDDSDAPSSRVQAMGALSAAEFPVQWSGTDGTNGSGIAFYDLYVSVNGGPFTNWLPRTTASAAIFSGKIGTRYAFYSIATDAVGNTELPPATADAETLSSASAANTTPKLAAVPAQVVSENQGLVVQLSGSDTDLPSQSLTYRLVSGPNSAILDEISGRFTWTPVETDGGSLVNFAVSVSDNGLPSLSSTQTFSVTIKEANQAPQIASVPPLSVEELSSLTYTMSAVDLDIPANHLTWSLGLGAPLGLKINSTTGVITWTPTEDQGPGNYDVPVIVTDDGVPALSETRFVSIAVTEKNTTPTLGVISLPPAMPLELLSATLTAQDFDLPAQKLIFNFASPTPAGLRLKALTGELSWKPTREQARTTNTVTVKVTDSGFPPLSTSKPLVIVVNDLAELVLGNGLVLGGQTTNLPVSIWSSTPITNISGVITVPGTETLNWQLSALPASVSSASLQPLGGDQYRLTLAFKPGLPLRTETEVARLSFGSKPSLDSKVLPLLLEGVTALKNDGKAIDKSAGVPGRIVYAGKRPILETVLSGVQGQVILYGVPGTSLTLQSTPSMNAPQVWSPFWQGAITNLSQVYDIPRTNRILYFRALTQ